MRPASPPLTGLASPFQRQFDFRGQGAGLRQNVVIGGQTYREMDNGRANVLVPVNDPLRPPKLLAQQRQAVVNSLFMAQSPIAGGAYGVASMLGASPKTRENAMMAGAAADAGLSAYAPRNASVRRPAPAGKATPVARRDGSVRERGVNAAGQAQGVNMTLVPSMLTGGTEANRRLKPPGFVSGKAPYNHSRAHLRAKELGGSGDDMSNMVTLTQTPTNSPWMRDVENEVVRRVRAGEIVDYAVTPLYTPGVAAPGAILLNVSGDKGPFMGRLLMNPAGRPKK